MQRVNEEALPTGVVTFLVTDLEGYTKSMELDETRTRVATKSHLDQFSQAIVSHRGTVVKTVGDSVVAAFASARDAITCATELREAAGDSHDPVLPVRIAISTGHAVPIENDYHARVLNRVARLCGALSGGQIVLSNATKELVEDALPPGVRLFDLGVHELRDIPATRYWELFGEAESPVGSLRTASRHVQLGNLPSEKRPFVGRSAERAALGALVGKVQGGVVTITGLGGIGKSRLALQVATDVRNIFPDGAWWFDATFFEDAGDLDGSVVAAIPNLSGETRALCVFDCFEESFGARPGVEQLVEKYPRLCVLVTSRRPLGIIEEREFPLLPLQSTSGGQGTKNDSLALMVSAASFADATFRITAKNRHDLLRLCELLEGVPLAILIAASRLRFHTPREMIDMVQRHRLDLTWPHEERHRTLRGVISSSIAMLPDSEQVLLRRASIFPGDFGMEDFQKVLGEPGGLASIEQFQGLVTHSLIQQRSTGLGSRYRVLDSVREYLSELPPQASNELDESRFVECYLAHAKAIGLLASKGRWREAVDRLWSELPSIRHLRSLLSRDGDTEGIATLCNDLSRTLFQVGLWTDYEQLESIALPQAASSGDWRMESRLCGLRGALERRRNRPSLAAAAWERRLELCRAGGDLEAAADAAIDLCNLALETNRRERALEQLDWSEQTAEALKSDAILARARAIRARIEGAEEPARAISLIQEAKKLAERSANHEVQAFVLHSGAETALLLGEYGLAHTWTAEHLQIVLEGDQQYEVALASESLAKIAIAEKRDQDAQFWYGTASALHRDLGSGYAIELPLKEHRVSKGKRPDTTQLFLTANDIYAVIHDKLGNANAGRRD